MPLTSHGRQVHIIRKRMISTKGWVQRLSEWMVKDLISVGQCAIRK